MTKITVTIELEDDTKLSQDIINLLASGAAESSSENTGDGKPAGKSRKRRTKAEIAAEAAEADSGSESEPESQHTEKEVRTALKEYAAMESKAAAIKIINDAGATSISEIKPSMFDDIMAALQD